MIVEVWEDSESTTVLIKGNKQKHLALKPDAKLIRTIKGKNWEDCMKKHFKLMGWKPYKPI